MASLEKDDEIQNSLSATSVLFLFGGVVSHNFFAGIVLPAIASGQNKHKENKHDLVEGPRSSTFQRPDTTSFRRRYFFETCGRLSFDCEPLTNIPSSSLAPHSKHAGSLTKRRLKFLDLRHGLAHGA